MLNVELAESEAAVPHHRRVLPGHHHHDGDDDHDDHGDANHIRGEEEVND